MLVGFEQTAILTRKQSKKSTEKFKTGNTKAPPSPHHPLFSRDKRKKIDWPALRVALQVALRVG